MGYKFDTTQLTMHKYDADEGHLSVWYLDLMMILIIEHTPHRY